MKTPTNTDVPLAPVLVARMLSGALGEPESTWAMRLANGRRPTRQSPIPWAETEAGSPVYMARDVQAFIERTTAQRAVSVPAVEGELTTKATAVADVEAERPYVRVLWNAGTSQGAFGLSAAMARALSAKLLEAAKAAQKGAE